MPAFAVEADIKALMRVDAWGSGLDGSRVGLTVGHSGSAGYSLLFHSSTSSLRFLREGIAWGTSYTYSWTIGVWYGIRLRQLATGQLQGKVWLASGAEPGTWAYTHTYAARSGAVGLVGMSKQAGNAGTETAVSFDDVEIRVGAAGTLVYSDAFGGTLDPGWAASGGTWGVAGGVVANAVATGDPNKLLRANYTEPAVTRVPIYHLLSGGF